MISNLLELFAMAAFVTGTYLEAGRAPAVFVLGFALVLLGLAAEGLALPKINRSLAARLMGRDSSKISLDPLYGQILTNTLVDKQARWVEHGEKAKPGFRDRFRRLLASGNDLSNNDREKLANQLANIFAKREAEAAAEVAKQSEEQRLYPAN